MLNRDLAVEHGGVEPSLAGWKNDHEVGIRRELEDEEIEPGAGLVLHPHKLLCVARGTGEAADSLLEVLHDVGHALQSVLGGIALALLRGPGGDGEERGALEEEKLLCLDGDAEVGEVAFDCGQVGDEVVDDACPGLVEALVPDAGGEGGDVEAASGGRGRWAGGVVGGVWVLLVEVADAVCVLCGALANDADAVVVDGFAVGGDDEVHLVDEDVDFGAWGELEEGGDNGDVGCEVAVNIAGLNVEDVDENADVGEDVDALLGKVVFHKGLLAAAVPEVECEVSEEFDVGEVDVYCCAAVWWDD